MRLATVDDPLCAGVQDVLTRRLAASGDQPLAVALSGGGDSTALLLLVADWAASRGRRLVALTVDHRLQARSAAWTERCAALAGRVGAGFRALEWTGDKPATGLAAAARLARHGLLADAAREAGATVILMGHTADDRLEAAAMRQAGSTTPDAREWAPSPAWPQGRGIFLLRPLIDQRRAALRAWLAARSVGWIDDPANEDPGSARARARRAGVDGVPPPPPEPPAGLARLAGGLPGGLFIPRAALLDTAAPEDLRRFLALAAVCAGGGARRPARASLERLSHRLATESAFSCTLAGASVHVDADRALFVRTAGERARGALSPLRLLAGQTAVWDGRFEIVARRDVEIRSLAGLATHLPAEQRLALAALPAPSRPGLPVLAGEPPTCPVLGPTPDAVARDLVKPRLDAAAGLVLREPEPPLA